MQRSPVGVVLAGGAGRRLGGAKATASLAGRPLAAWVAAALREVVGEVVLAARADSALPELGLAVWREPVDGPPHPLAGLAAAVDRSEGRGVLACPVDLPFVDARVLRGLLDAPGEVAVASGQPLLGRFGPGVGARLGAAARAGDAARAVIAALNPTVVTVVDPGRTLLNVNTPGDLARAEDLVRRASGAARWPSRR